MYVLSICLMIWSFLQVINFNTLSKASDELIIAKMKMFFIIQLIFVLSTGYFLNETIKWIYIYWWLS
jgi:hypothetical protein